MLKPRNSSGAQKKNNMDTTTLKDQIVSALESKGLGPLPETVIAELVRTAESQQKKYVESVATHAGVLKAFRRISPKKSSPGRKVAAK